MPEGGAIAGGAAWRWSVAPGAAPALAAWRIGATPDPGEQRGRRLGRNEGREVRVLADRAGERPTLYLKWFDPALARRARREERRLTEIARRGGRVAPLFACARRADGATLLVLGELAGRALDEWLGSASPAERRRESETLGAALAALHRRGVHHRRLFAWHIVVGADGSVGWLDVGDAALSSGRPSPRARASDLAALFATVARERWPLAARARLLRAYEPDRALRRALAAAIERERPRLLRHARVPRDWPHREWRSDRQRLLVAEAFAASAEREARTGIDEWLAPAGAVAVRARDGRTNLRWLAPAGEARGTWFGKRFEDPPWRGRAFAFREYLALRALAAIGVPTPRIVAVGRREGGPSVLWTAAVEPGSSVRERLLELPPAGAGAGERRRLLADAALLARRLHAAGFVHRDLYLDHFLVEERNGSRGLVLIDATRVALRPRLPARARTKDLAALEFSARAAGASRSERWRALEIYARGDRRLARSLARAAVAKADRIARRERRHGRPAPRA